MSDHKNPENRFLGDIEEVRDALKQSSSSNSYYDDLTTIASIKYRLTLHKSRLIGAIVSESFGDDVERLQTVLNNSNNETAMAMLYALERTETLRLILSRLVLRGLDLSNILLTSLEIEGLDLSETVIKEGYFQDSDLRRASFRNVIFERVVFDNCVLEAANFEGAKLTNCWLAGHMNNVAFISATIHDSTLTGSCQQANFTQADLRGTRFRELNIYGCDFRDANLLGTLHDGVFIDTQVTWPDGTKYHPIKNSGTRFFIAAESGKGV